MELEKFDVVCQSCGSKSVRIEDRSEFNNDGGGHIDKYERYYIICNSCENEEETY